MDPDRRSILKLLGGCAMGAAVPNTSCRSRDPIRVGVLHSLTGTMAISERSVVDATLLAIEELNAKGGLLDRPILPIVVDGRSDWPTFAREAERLIQQEKVCTVFGCWTSASRRTVRGVFEANNHLLIYPVQYEGIEQSPNIVYTGAAPNQQIIPAVAWAFEHVGRKLFLVGSDYIFPRVAHAIIRDHVKLLRGEILGEEYLLLGSTDVKPVVDAIVRAVPDIIFNTINGDTNVAFFRALRASGITPAKIPTMSVSIAEDELRSMDARELAGDYTTWNYFQRIDSEKNRSFVAAFRAKYGADRVTDDPMEAAYLGVHLWAQAVAAAGSDDVRSIRRAMLRKSFEAPEGVVHIEPENQHTWKTVRVGRIRDDGQFDIVWTSERPIRPSPYPITRSRDEWNAFVESLFQKWGGRWANPGK
jgi:urea transport system substrate-binding protein